MTAATMLHRDLFFRECILCKIETSVETTDKTDS